MNGRPRLILSVGAASLSLVLPLILVEDAVLAKSDHKCTLVHNNHTISIDIHAVPAHLALGDEVVGECPLLTQLTAAEPTTMTTPDTTTGEDTTSGDTTGEAPTVASFGSEDTTQTTPVEVSPSGGDTGVTPATKIQARFSTPLETNTLNSSNVKLTKDHGKKTVKSNLSISSDQKILKISPTQKLAKGQTYKVTLKGGPKGIKDTSRHQLVKDLSWSFRTAK